MCCDKTHVTEFPRWTVGKRAARWHHARSHCCRPVASHALVWAGQRHPVQGLPGPPLPVRSGFHPRVGDRYAHMLTPSVGRLPWAGPAFCLWVQGEAGGLTKWDQRDFVRTKGERSVLWGCQRALICWNKKWLRRQTPGKAGYQSGAGGTGVSGRGAARTEDKESQLPGLPALASVPRRGCGTWRGGRAVPSPACLPAANSDPHCPGVRCIFLVKLPKVELLSQRTCKVRCCVLLHAPDVATCRSPE